MFTDFFHIRINYSILVPTYIQKQNNKWAEQLVVTFKKYFVVILTKGL